MVGGRIRGSQQRIGVFVDVQNMFYSAKALHQSKIDYSKLLLEIVSDRNLIRAIAYVVQKARCRPIQLYGCIEPLRV